MSELIDNSRERKARLKELILKLHNGEPEEKVREELLDSLSTIPYGEVVEVEQELISEGLPESEVLKLCDVHSAVLEGRVDLSGSREVPGGHPVDVMKKENAELRKVTAQAADMLFAVESLAGEEVNVHMMRLLGLFNQLYDVDKHYLRKEYLLFPYLENHGITGPPKVMWGKHDEIRDLLKGSIEILRSGNITGEELAASAEIVLKPALKGINDMTWKEEEILFPMSLDKLAETDWLEIDRQSPEIGYCLYDPQEKWRPAGASEGFDELQQTGQGIRLPSGGFSVEELLAILNNLPLDMTFVDRNDKVRYFSQGEERVFQRNRAILNRDVRHCHPPASSHIVDKIVDDFKSGRESRAPFWIQMGEKFIHIEYFALRGKNGEYLGTLEVSHDVNRYRRLEGEQRILSYTKNDEK
jgi:uncharacterized protein